MLQPGPAQLVAEPQQEIVVSEVAGSEQPVRLNHQGLVGLDLRRLGHQLGGLIGHDVQADRRLARGVEVDHAEEAAGHQRRVDEGVQGDRLVDAARASRLQRRGCREPLGQGDARRQGDIPREVTGGVEHDRIPVEIEHRRRHVDMPLFRRHRRQVLESDLERGRSGGRIDVEGGDLHRVAAPGDALAVGGDYQPGELVDCAARRVMTGDPLGVEQRDRPAPRQGDGLADGEDAVRQIGGVDLERQDARVWRIARRLDRRRRRRGHLGGGRRAECRARDQRRADVPMQDVQGRTFISVSRDSGSRRCAARRR